MRTRRCIATGETVEDARLIRFALGPDAVVTPDLGARLPGRGVWVTANRDSVDLAVKRKAFARGFKMDAVVASDLADQVDRLLAQRCLDLLGLARRAGAAAFGAERVEQAIRRARQPFLIFASDGSDQGRQQMQRLAFGLWGAEPKVIGCFTAAELGLAFGVAPVVYAALPQEGMARRWLIEADRLTGFRAITPASWPAGGDPRRPAADGE
jgi:predicted RNA-binding protein YlxR (DUF448 family)